MLVTTHLYKTLIISSVNLTQLRGSNQGLLINLGTT